MNERERQVMTQMMKDGNDYSKEARVMNWQEIMNVRSKYIARSASIGTVVVNLELTDRGGNLSIREIAELRREWKGYGEYMDVRCFEQEFLIEPPNYQSSDIQPFNRQAPYYIGTRFDYLESTEVGNWMVRSSLKEHNHLVQNVMFPTRNFSYLHGILKGTQVVEKNSVKRFIEELLTTCLLPSTVIEEIIRHID